MSESQEIVKQAGELLQQAGLKFVLGVPVEDDQTLSILNGSIMDIGDSIDGIIFNLACKCKKANIDKEKLKLNLRTGIESVIDEAYKSEEEQ